METFAERYTNQIRGVISCFDRVVISGTLPNIRYSGAMAAYLTTMGLKLFEFTTFVNHDKSTGRTTLKACDGKCLHYYFYFIEKELGLCYLRVPTWAPFRLQFYFNGHNWLARQLDNKGFDFNLVDNAFIDIS